MTCGTCENRRCKDAPFFTQERIAKDCLDNGRKLYVPPITEDGDILARWKGAGMGEYYCSLCCEVGDIRELRCPKCNALMYTDEEYNRKIKEWELEDSI